MADTADAAGFKRDVDIERVKQVLAGTNGELAQRLLTAGLRIERLAKQLCPVDTGRLRSSITTRLGESDDGLPYVDIGSAVSYAPYLEYGTERMAAQPFLTPAVVSIVGRNVELRTR